MFMFRVRGLQDCAVLEPWLAGLRKESAVYEHVCSHRVSRGVHCVRACLSQRSE